MDDMPNYSLVEEVQETWEEEGSRRHTELGRTEERTLEVDERILEAQNTWTGRGRFILKYQGEVGERHVFIFWPSINYENYGYSILRQVITFRI